MPKKLEHEILEAAVLAREEELKDDAEAQLNDMQDRFDELDTLLVERQDAVVSLSENTKEIQRLGKEFGLSLVDGKLVSTKGESPLVVNVKKAKKGLKRAHKAAGRKAAPELDLSKYHLADFLLLGVSQGINHPMILKNFALDYGFKTTSKKFQDVVHQCLSHSQFFRRHGRSNWGRTRKGMGRWLQIQGDMMGYFESMRRSLP